MEKYIQLLLYVLIVNSVRSYIYLATGRRNLVPAGAIHFCWFTESSVPTHKAAWAHHCLIKF
jgi:hypothetical protein